ncbi:hypothetical protein [Pseudomonas chlororaphis]|uniref:Uncharacterized protein n=1 Tax=Pseudomonas chlororaphis O6 TaxID=1037915 RepID=A0AB33WSV7_9PSED|nr:hypothetical protein [Pseudomonas chlororaphis]EIM16203.1 hypothetical protein PchlO6_1248 [Pseudomonas chlororaphis O6]MBP5058917.1 hypothetical protein [Pseudomonas chlororaphis]MBP5140307.1 hypothetical protein [Pseudomonas chlororaphis]QTT99498.1 hypothetical protein HUT26_09505 [Pseudomonas chlororaphis]
MKIRALGVLTGASGDREKGEEFVVDKEYGAGLISRGYAVEVVEVAATTDKADKPGKTDLAKE